MVEVHHDVWDTQHLLRHITRIQVKNFTPFPARDAFTSALSQPAEQSQFNAFGNLSDDLDVALARKRVRKISTTSVDTMKSLGLDGLVGAEDTKGSGSMGAHDFRGRKRTMSRASVLERYPAGSSPVTDGTRRHPPIAGSGPTIRPHRPRTNSIASSSSSIHLPNGAPSPSASVVLDHSQATLEKILQSRLVETFLAVTVPPRRPERSQAGSSSVSSSRSASPQIWASPPHSTPSSREKFSSANRKVRSPHASPRRPAPADAIDTKPSKHGPHMSIPSSTSLRSSMMPSAPTHRRAASSSVKLNGVRPSSTSYTGTEPSGSHPTSVPPSNYNATPSVPNYFSAIHIPSTNLSFPLDFRSGYELPPWTDLAATELHIQLWGKAHPIPSHRGGKEKGKNRATDESMHDPQWRVMEQWTINLTDLVPLPDELAAHPSQLPSNSLLVTLSPPDRVFYLSPQSLMSRTRAPSLSGGYSSDPEVRNAGDLILPMTSSLSGQTPSVTPKRALSPQSTDRISRLRGETSRSAGWQDLVKLVNLQSAILDTQQSLSKIVQDIDPSLAGDEVARLNRDISEREARLAEWKSARSAVNLESDRVAQDIKARREELQRRRDMLALATEMTADDDAFEDVREAKLSEERSRSTALQSRLAPVRITLISTLSSIFPIELLSGPDLLYTILDVPLPIPLGTTDPAPPLTLPSHKEVTEDGISTALAYAALVVQLLAQYLGKGLVYPITYIGSKSMIRDGISAMVGPRMFPLFSKGVDTYRFEYGVFLLNKDIEMLMSERNLRALDMRHTLPNLKNLLLTLTDGEGARLVALSSPVLSATGLESPPRPSTPVESSSTGEALSISIEPAPNARADTDSHSSGSTTPSASKPTSDAHHGSLSIMSKPFFGLSGFLRSRYPSSSQQPSVKAVPETPEGGAEDTSSRQLEQSPSDGPTLKQDGAPDEDEDRRTLRGVSVDSGDDAPDEVKHAGNGRAYPTEKDAKAVDEEDMPSIVSRMTAHT